MSQVLLSILAAIGSPAAVIGLWIAVSTVFFPWTRVDFHEGERIFQQRCASCHQVNDQAPSSFGPNLSRIGLEAAERSPRLTAEEYLLESILRPDAYRRPGTSGVMPADVSAGLTTNDIVSVVGYLSTLGSRPRPRRLAKLVVHAEHCVPCDKPQLDFTRVERGRQVYFGSGQCASCHPLRRLPGNSLAAPDLLQAGRHSEQYLRASILDPGKHIVAGYANVLVELATGRFSAGRLLTASDDQLELVVSGEAGITLERIPLEAVAASSITESITKLEQSTMPANYQSLLSDDDVDALVAFLRSLRY